ncbi:MAG: PilZ domain-containing protein [Oleiphilaceae bacterium]|nr:PilZ domain-containing protein [Oleiphilaceae bacterium]
MRAYIRHPADVPIEFSPLREDDGERSLVQDISLGGLSFSSSQRLQVGSLVKIRIPIVDPPFEAEARVIWCLSRPDRYEAGIEFTSSQDAYTARMVEQICHIEHYRMWVKEVEGRDLDGEHAAVEWIDKYAKDFPNISE